MMETLFDETIEVPGYGEEEPPLVDRLWAGFEELRHLPLGGRGHLAELMREAAEELAKRPAELSDVDAKALGPFARDSETSRQAALANYPRQGTQRWRVLRALWERGQTEWPGATRDELAADTGLSPNSVRPRVVELIAGGWVQAAACAPRKTALGEDAEVLVLSMRGEWAIGDEVQRSC